MDVAHELDASRAHRDLRDFVLPLAVSNGEAPDRVPHSFEPDDLFRYTERLLARPEVTRDDDVHLELVALLGVAYAVAGDDEKAQKHLSRGLRHADSNQKRARFEYHLGLHHHFRRGELARAKEVLEEAYLHSERSRRLRGQILLALGTVDLRLHNVDSAQRSFRSALDLHIKELEPQLFLRLGITEAMQCRPDRAVDLNRKGHALFAEQRDWRGMKLADASLGEHYLDDGEFARARDTLEPVVAEGFRMLDLARLGHDYGHLSVARSELGDATGARDAILEAIRFHHSEGHRASLVGDYQNLGDCLAEIGDHDTALAALDTALVLSRQQELAHEEFQVLSRLVAICARHGVIPDVMPHVMDRCRALMHVHAELLTKESLLHFARSLQGIVGSPSLRGPRSYPPPDPLRLGTPDGHERLALLLPKPQETDFAARLRSTLDEGLPGRDVPPADELHPFLWQYKGEFFKSGNYTREFGITQERAKRHLRSMCVAGIIERQGSRKASRYALAFHR